MQTYRIAHGLARILIGVVFIYTGIIHIADPAGFVSAVAAYRILPPFTVNAFALILPWIELLAGLAIATGIGLPGGALAAIGILVAFLIALSLSLYRGLDISCGCFSTSPGAQRISWIYLARDSALLLVAVFIFLNPRVAHDKPRSFQSVTKDRALVVLLVALGVAGIFLFQRLTRDPCEGVSLSSIHHHKQFTAPVMLGKRSVNGLCEVLIKTENNIVPVYLGKSFVIAGGMFQNRRDITGEGLKQITSRKFLALKRDIDAAAAFTYIPPGPGPIRHTLYMFISPTCPHCEEMLKEIRPVLDETRTVLKVLFYAKGQARDIAIGAVCQKIDLEMFLAKGWESLSEARMHACLNGLNVVEKSNALGARLGIDQVPTYFTERGYMLSGVPLPTLRGILGH